MTTIFHDMLHNYLEDYVDDIVVKLKEVYHYIDDPRRVFTKMQAIQLVDEPLVLLVSL